MTATNTRVVLRNAYLKRARFSYGRLKNPPVHKLETLLRSAQSGSRNWTQRHWPPRPLGSPPPDPGTRCMYLGRISSRRRFADGSGGGTYFTVGSYVYGKGEHQIAVDMQGASPDIQSGPLYDARGNQRSLHHEFRCVALGESLIVQNERGGGGLPALAQFLTFLLRTYNQGLNLPRLTLVDVFSNDLRKILIANGGVKRMRIRMIDPSAPRVDKPLAIATPLYQAHQAVKNTGRLTVEWEAEDEEGLDIDTAIDAYMEAQRDVGDLDSVDLFTLRGGPVRNVGKYKAKREIPVTIDSHGIENKSEIKPSLYEFLDELRSPLEDDDWRMIDDDGFFLSGRTLQTPTTE